MMLAVAAAGPWLGGYAEPDPALGALGRAGLVLAMVAVGVLERIQFRLKFLEGRTWWASNGRDVLNLVAFAVVAVALGLIGFGGPLALVIAGSMLILMIALQTAVGPRAHGTLISVAAAIALGAPVALAPEAVDGALKGMLLWLFR